MADTLTFGLVQITDRSGIEQTQVLKQVEGEYNDAYRCTLCEKIIAEDNACSVWTWVCVDCGNRTETDPGADAPRCCDDTEMDRTDGEDGTVEDRGCDDCLGGPVEDVSVFCCGVCSALIEEEDETAEEHLFEHLQGGWE
jgi:ribosomal protein L37AE/L43A